MDPMHLKLYAVAGIALAAGAAAIWRTLVRRRAPHHQPALQPERIRNVGRLVAGGGVRRIT